jgi:hypothetical protein
MPSSRTWVWVAVAIAATVVVAGAVYLVERPSGGPSSSPAPAGPTTISMLPSPGTRSDCIVGTPGVPRPVLPLHYGVFQANTYNVPVGTTGHIGMCYSATDGSLLGYANWSKVGAGGGWFSYPQVAYGVNDYLGEFTTYTNQSSAWVLPQTIGATINEGLWVTTTYAIHPPNSSDVDGYDLSLDDFVSQGLPPRLDMGMFVEVEIFLAHNISYPFEWVHWHTPTLVNATVVDAPWDVAWWCHGADNGSNDNVSFDFSFDGQSTHGLLAGTLGVNLSAVMSEVVALIPSASCWEGDASEFPSFYLGEEDLGSEDGALGGASYNYNWTVDSYCLNTKVTGLQPSAMSCGTASAGPSTTGSLRLGEPGGPGWDPALPRAERAVQR